VGCTYLRTRRASLARVRLGGGICPAAGEQHPAGPIPLTAHDLTLLELTVVGIRGARHRDALGVLSLLEQGLLHTPIAARFPLAPAAEVHRLLENNTGLAGLVVVKPHAATAPRRPS
jgi:putative oxidoreductase